MTQFEILHVKDGNVRHDLKCTACELCDSKEVQTNCMRGEGFLGADFMFVGFAPGKEDDIKGRPYVGPTGLLLKDLLRQSGIDPNKVYMTNCLRCHPGKAKISSKNYKACRAHLQQEVARVHPKVLVAVGTNAFEWLSGWKGVSRFRKHLFPSTIDPKLLVTPIFQPARLFQLDGTRKSQERTNMVEDLLWLKQRSEENRLTMRDDMETDYRMAQSLQEVDEFLAEFDDVDEVACDFETSSLFPEEGEVVVAVGFSKGPGHGRAIPLYAWGLTTLHYWTDEEVEGYIKPRLREFFKKKVVYGHNFVQFDQKWARRLIGTDRLNIKFDLMYAHYLTNEEKGTHDLEQLAMEHTTMPPWKNTFLLTDTEVLCEYLCKDVDATARIRPVVEAQLTSKQAWLLRALLIPVGHDLMDFELDGVAVHHENLKLLSKTLSLRISEVVGQLRKIPEVQMFELEHNTALNVNSSKHLSTVMEDYLHLPCLARTGQGKFSTAAWVLQELEGKSEFVHLVLQIRGLAKLKGTYCDGLIKRIKNDGRLHSNYLLHGTVTGRPASRDPNLMNIPREDTGGKVLEDGSLVKDVFSADSNESLFLQADFSQAELRILACKSRDEKLISIFQAGVDIHTATAAEAYGISLEEVTKTQRTNAKSMNFGLVYGMSIQSLQEKFVKAGSTAEDATRFMDVHMRTFKGVWRWLEEQEKVIRSNGYQETVFGRRRHFGYIDGHAINQAKNFPIQSEASDVTLFGLIAVQKQIRQLGLQSKGRLTVYDSIVWNVPFEEFWIMVTLVKTLLENQAFDWLVVPMKVDLEAGRTWGQLKPVDLENQRVG